MSRRDEGQVHITSPVAGITVLEVLGHGGFSVVYRARQESVGREVALKVDNRVVRDERDRRRFLREAHAAGQLSDHPNVISVFDAGITEDGRPYLVMELCTAGSLADRLRKDGPLPAADVREIGVRIADALETAHQAGVLHRDMKPANILVNRFGGPGLADFGLAATHDPSRQLSATLEALTPAYAAPEVFRMERPTTAVDVYGLGATLYSLLSGRPPRWPAEGYPSIATIIGLQNEPVPDLPGVPNALTAVLRRAMANEPAERYPSAGVFRDALTGVALDVPTGMFTAIPAEAAPTSPAPASPAWGTPAAAVSAPPAATPAAPTSPAWGTPAAAASTPPAATPAAPTSPAWGSPAAAAATPVAAKRAAATPGAATPGAPTSPARPAGAAPTAAMPAAVAGTTAVAPPIRGAAAVPTRPLPAGQPGSAATPFGQPGSAATPFGAAPTRVGGPPPPMPGPAGGRPPGRPVAPGGPGAGRKRRKWPLVLVAAMIAGIAGIGFTAMAYQLGASKTPGNRGTELPTGTDTAGPAETPVQNEPPAAAAPTQKPSYDSGGSTATSPSLEPTFRGADPDTITAVGLGPFRTGEPVRPLLDAGVAERPSGEGPCDPERMLISTRNRYNGVSAWQEDDDIAHVTIRNPSFGTRSGLRVGSTPDEIKTVAPDAEEFSGDGTLSYLIRSGGNGLLFIIVDGQTRAIMVGPRSDLEDVAGAEGGRGIC